MRIVDNENRNHDGPSGYFQNQVRLLKNVAMQGGSGDRFAFKFFFCSFS